MNVRLIPSARGFRSAINREIGGDLKKAGGDAGDKTSRHFGQTFKSGIGKAAKIGAAAFAGAFVGAAVLGKQAIASASDLEESQNKVNVVFGDGAEAVREFARGAATSLGQSEAEALSAAGSFGNMFVQLGIGSDTAADMSTSMVSLASDFASFHNADISEVISAQEAAFRGEYDAVQRFVPTINAAAVEQRALEMGLADTTSELDAQDKALAVQALLMEGAGDATGDFARTSDGLANRQRIMTAQWNDAKAALGRGLMPIASALFGYLSKILPVVADKAAEFTDWLGKKFVKVWPKIRKAVVSVFDTLSRSWIRYGKPVFDGLVEGARDVVGWIVDRWPAIRRTVEQVFDAVRRAIGSVVSDVLPRIIDGFRTFVVFLIDHRPILIGIFAALAVGMAAWAVSALAAAAASTAAWIAAAAPFVAIGVAIAAVVAGFIYAYQNIEGFRKLVDTVVDAVVAAAGWLADQWSQHSHLIGEAISAIGSTVSNVFGWITGVISDAMPTIRSIISTGVDLAVTAWNGIEFIYTWFRDNVAKRIPVWFRVIRDTARTVLETAVDWAVTAWNGIEVIYTWFRDNVAKRIGVWFRNIRDTAQNVLLTAVTWAKTAWEGMKVLYTWFRDSVALKIGVWFRNIRDTAQNVLRTAVTWAKTAWEGMKVLYTWFRDSVALKIAVWFRQIRDTAQNVLRTAVTWAKTAWNGMQVLYTWFRDNVALKIAVWFRNIRDTAQNVLRTAVTWAKTAWAGMLAIYTFFRDSVFTPLKSKATEIKNHVIAAFTAAKNGVKSAWAGMLAIYQFFRDSVFTPLKTKVTEIKNHVIAAFTAAKDGVKVAWDLLKDIVKAPINLVIGFYNNGIRAVWNAVIDKIPGVGSLAEIVTLNRGGSVPGSGSRDTVPAMLTPGEFVITKKAAASLGPQVLNALNRGGTLDPGVFGYSAGGYARSADEALEWARQQSGKPYRFPDVGPDSYDCSGFTSALINYILGRNPYSRRHSSGSMGSDPALARGGGDNPKGALFGSRPPFMVNSAGALVGHVTATLSGVNMEATPPRVRVGGNARGADSLVKLFHLPDFGGLSDEDKGIVDRVRSLLTMKLEGLTPPLGDLLQKMVNKLPGQIYDFFMKKLPSIIVEGVKDFGGAVLGGVKRVGSWVNPFAADGGDVVRSGPILVGERGPEMVWASRGMFIQSNEMMARDSGGRRERPFTLNHYGQTVDPASISAGIRMARTS